MLCNNTIPVICQAGISPLLSIEFSRKFVSALHNAGVKSQLVEMPGGRHAPESYGQTLGYFEYQGKKYELKPAVYGLAFGFWNVVELIPNMILLTVSNFYIPKIHLYFLKKNLFRISLKIPIFLKNVK